MLPELLLQLVTPASGTLRRMGLVRDSIGLWSRGPCKNHYNID